MSLTQPSAVPSDFTSVVMMMAQTLQAVQAQTQAMTQLATVISQQQQQQQSLQQQQQQPQPQATAPLAPSVSGTQSETKADSAGKLDLEVVACHAAACMEDVERQDHGDP